MYSGYWLSGFKTQGSNGDYWSSTQQPSRSVDAYGLYFISSFVNPSNDDSKQYGFAIRCIAN